MNNTFTPVMAIVLPSQARIATNNQRSAGVIWVIDWLTN
jgi:hypothetical protein